MIQRLSRAVGALFVSTILSAAASATDLPEHGAAASPDVAPAMSSSDARYCLQPGDVIEVSVWKEPDLSKDVLVRPDGGISFPLVGDLMAKGLTPMEVQKELAARLAAYIPDAAVTVAVHQINGNQIYVLGKVNRPGAYRFDRPIDVMQALSLAGGTTEFAGIDDIRILRRAPDGRQQAFPFEYSSVARGRDLGQNIVLESGDTLVVP
jgi:polysaccharide biosynthesis/export protein